MKRCISGLDLKFITKYSIHLDTKDVLGSPPSGLCAKSSNKPHVGFECPHYLKMMSLDVAKWCHLNPYKMMSSNVAKWYHQTCRDLGPNDPSSKLSLYLSLNHLLNHSLSHSTSNPPSHSPGHSQRNFLNHFPSHSCNQFFKPFIEQSPRQMEISMLESDWLAPHHPIPNDKFPQMTASLNRHTYHKSAKVSPPPCPTSHGYPKSTNELIPNQPAMITCTELKPLSFSSRIKHADV